MPTLPTISLRPTTLFLRRASRALAVACLLAAAGGASAQLFVNPEWKESDVPPPPAFDESRLLPIEMPRYMTLKFGVDPATIAINGDGVVRYVVVATNKAGGATNAYYEGVRCATGEMKTYARFGSKAWDPVPAPEWKKMWELNSSYTLALSQQAICRGAAPRGSVNEMVQRLKNPLPEVQ